MEFKLVCAVKSCNKTILSSHIIPSTAGSIKTLYRQSVLGSRHQLRMPFHLGLVSTFAATVLIRTKLDRLSTKLGWQSENGFKELISCFRTINEKLFAFYSQFCSLQLLNESYKRKKSASAEIRHPVQPKIMQVLLSLASKRAGSGKNSNSKYHSINENRIH